MSEKKFLILCYYLDQLRMDDLAYYCTLILMEEFVSSFHSLGSAGIFRNLLS